MGEIVACVCEREGERGIGIEMRINVKVDIEISGKCVGIIKSNVSDNTLRLKAWERERGNRIEI